MAVVSSVHSPGEENIKINNTKKNAIAWEGICEALAPLPQTLFFKAAFAHVTLRYLPNSYRSRASQVSLPLACLQKNDKRRIVRVYRTCLI